MIAKSAEADTYEELVKFLLMVRKKVKDSKVDSELVFAYAKTGQLGPLEEFISSAQQANLQSAGDRCVHCARLGSTLFICFWRGNCVLAAAGQASPEHVGSRSGTHDGQLQQQHLESPAL